MLIGAHNSLVHFPMRLATRTGSLLALLALLVCGCSSGRYTTMYLNQLVHERAEQEVKLETMSLDLEAAQNTISSLQSEIQKLRDAESGAVDSKPIRNRRVPDAPATPPAIDKQPKGGSPKAESSPTDDLTSAPDLELGPIDDEPSSSGLEAKQASLKKGEEADVAPDVDAKGSEAFLPTKTAKPKDDASEGELPDPKSSSESKPDATQSTSDVVALAIDKNQTRGEDLDGQSGDEGVLVVLQPRDSSGKYIPLTGSVIIEVIDSPTQSKADPSAQVAEWKFSQEEVRRATRNSALGRGAYLSVDWDEHRPAHEKLLIIARWKSPSGEELTAEQVVRVNLQKSLQAWDSRLNRADQSEGPAASVATKPSNSTESKHWAPSRR